MKRKIVIFHTEFFFSGGAEHTLLETISYFNNNGYNAIAYAPYVNYNTCFPDSIDPTTIKPLLPGWFTRIPLPREFFIIIAAILAPLLLIQFKNTTVFYGANQLGPYLAFIAAKLHHRPYLVYMPYPQGFLYPRKIDLEFGEQSELHPLIRMLLKRIKPLFRKLDYKIIKAAGAVITEGTYSQKIFSTIYQREIINCPPGTTPISENEIINTNRFKGQLVINKQVITKPYILVTNRHMPKKRFEYAIEIIAGINQIIDNGIQLVITGSTTEYTSSLVNLIKQKNLGQKVIFTEYTTEKDTLTLYQNAAVYIYTAPEEDFGKGIIQAMSCAVPVVAWNNAGPSGIIENEITGYTITPFNLNEFKNCTLQILENEELNYHLGKKAWESAATKFSIEKHNQTISTCISQLSHLHNRLPR